MYMAFALVVFVVYPIIVVGFLYLLPCMSPFITSLTTYCVCWELDKAGIEVHSGRDGARRLWDDVPPYDVVDMYDGRRLPVHRGYVIDGGVPWDS